MQLTERVFDNKEDARNWVWDRLQAEGLARFPFPPHGRIPNYVDADLAANRLFEQAPWQDSRDIKVNPDSPQRAVRLLALQKGIRVYVPTPRLTGGFHLLDPEAIAPGDYQAAATLKSMADYSRPLALSEMPQLDAIVTGCAAVTRAGKRCGKGEGYSDIEFALLRELGHAPVPVATTVHDAQLVTDFPIEANDLPLSLICTPTDVIRIESPLPAPDGIDWSRLDDADLERMPLLLDLQTEIAK